MFATFFKKNELRTISLLTKITPRYFVAKSDLTTLLNTTKPTLNRDIKELEVILKEYPDLPQILNYRDYVKLLPGKKHCNMNSLLLIVIQLYLKNSYSYQIIQILTHRKKVFLQDFCDEIAISKSYFMQVLASLNHYLYDYHLQIKIKENYVQFDGPIENIFFFSFLMADAHTKLFNDHGYSYTKSLTEVEPHLTDDINVNFNPVNTRKALNLYYQFDLYKEELHNMELADKNAKELLAIFEKYYPIFNKALPDSYRPYLSFVVNITFTQLRDEEQHIKTLDKLLSHSHDLIPEAVEIADMLLALIPPLPYSQQIIFRGTVFSNFIYLLTFRSELKKPFNNVQFIRDILNEKERHVPVNLKTEMRHDKFKHLDNNSLLSLFYKHLLIFEYVLELFHLQNTPTKLHIHLDFENSIIFEDYLKNQLIKLFNQDALVFEKTDEHTDVIISDQLYKADHAKYFFYFASIQSEQLLEDLLSFLTRLYLKKRKCPLSAMTEKSTLFI